jgi:Leucine-rich repeat (LRR) protein
MNAVLTLGLLLAAQPGGQQEKAPEHVAPEIRAAWGKKSILSGWVGYRDGGFIEFRSFTEGKPGDLPVFLVLSPAPGALADLPQPDRNFGVLIYPGPEKGFKLGAADLKALGGMKRLVFLTVSGTRVPDGSLKEFAAAKALRRLYLLDTDLGDAAAADIAALSQLESLSLNDNTEVSNAGAKELAKLKNLKWLSLGHTKVTDIAELAPLEKLEYLFLPGTKVADADLDGLAAFKELRGLYLSGTKVSDAGMPKLAALTGLRDLNMNGTFVTDDGVARLADLKSLKTLQVQNTKVTADGAKKLEDAIPGLKVQR